jgi:hypothetical protein
MKAAFCSRMLVALVFFLPVASPAETAQAPGPPAEGFEVVVQVNDSMVKDKALSGVRILLTTGSAPNPVLLGETGADGRLVVRLAPGEARLSYQRQGYVSILDSPVQVREEGQVITTTMTMLLEADGAEGRAGPRRVQIVLNWGSDDSQVRDADSHLVCGCERGAHVYFGNKSHQGSLGHRVELDVDDVDWGGPETITLSDPPPGEHIYWVHNFSQDANLADAEAVVRVVIGDRLAGEFRLEPGWTVDAWRPFRSIQVAADGAVRLVSWNPSEIAAGEKFRLPSTEGLEGDHQEEGWAMLAAVGALGLFWLVTVIIRIRRRI